MISAEETMRMSAILMSALIVASGRAIKLLAFTSAIALTTVQVARSETVLYSFAGADGAIPVAGLILDAKGNIYGTTYGGGASGFGTVFQITSAGTEKVLYSFSGGADGSGPISDLVEANGNFYGTTIEGGGAGAVGTVFKVTSTSRETVLASLTLEDGGAYPEGGLVRDKHGNLYGTTSGYNGGYGNGAVFKVSSSGKLTILYTFQSGDDGLCPYGDLLLDAEGNLYGTTYRGGTSGLGTVFEITPSGSETVLYSFTGGTDGSLPAAGLFRDVSGNLYGTTTGGGNGYGTVFKVTPDGTETIVHSFTDSDGYYPIAPLVQDAKGNFYGTTEFGGRHGQGTVFKLTGKGIETVVHSFTGKKDGGSPVAGLIFDTEGNLYGTTSGGGNTKCVGGCGVVFKIVP
jgi:uncharacterized repeat protein (TIGR03803 family)